MQSPKYNNLLPAQFVSPLTEALLLSVPTMNSFADSPQSFSDDRFSKLLSQLQKDTAKTYQFASKVTCTAGCRTGVLVGLSDGTILHISVNAIPTTLGRHNGSLTCLCVFERTAISGSEDATLKVWTLDDMTETATLIGHENSISCLAVTSDGKSVVTGSYDTTVKFWNLTEGIAVATFRGHSQYVTCVALTPDRKNAVSGSMDWTIIIWSLDSMQRVATFNGHSGQIWCLAVTADGTHLVSGSWDNTLKVWDLAEKTEIASFPGHTHDGNSVIITSDDNLIFGSQENCLQVVNLPEMKETTILKGHKGPITCLAISPDGKYFVSGSEDKDLKVWNLDDMQEIATLEGHTDRVETVSITPDGKRVVSRSADNTLKIWSLDDMKRIATLQGHTEQVFCISVSSDGHKAVSGSSDQTLKVWDLDDMKEIEVLQGHADRIYCVAISPDNLKAVSGSKDTCLKVWDLAEMKEIGTFQEHTGPVFSVAIMSDGLHAVSGSRDKTIKIWSLIDFREEKTLEEHTGGVWAVVVTRDGQRIVSGSDDHTVKVWNLADSTDGKTLEKGHIGWVRCLALTADDKYLVSGSGDKTLKVWDMTDLTEVVSLEGHTSGVWCLALTPDCKYAISGSEDKTLKVWSLEDMKEITSLPGYLESVSCLAVTPDGKRVLVGSGKVIFIINLTYELQPYRIEYFKDFKTDQNRWRNSHYRQNYSLFSANIEKLKKGLLIDLKVAAHTVYPHFFNSLHVCVYFNHFELLSTYLKGKVPVIRGAFGSPLTIALTRNTRKCLEVLIQHFIEICEANNGRSTIEEITEDLPQLITSKSSLITQFFSVLLRPTDQPGLPQFLSPLFPLPITRFSYGTFIKLKDFAKLDDPLIDGNQDLAEVVEFSTSFFRWNFLAGSSRSLKFLRALEACKDTKVLTTPLVTTIIECKWNSLWPITLGMTLLYVCLLAALVSLQFKYLQDDYVSSIFLVLNGFFLVYEGIQGIISGLEYWKDIWNSLDILRGALSVFWVFMLYFDTEKWQHLQLLVVCLCFARGFTYFRTFKMTRMFVRMTLEVVQEMYSFLVILLYSTFAFGLMYSVASPDTITSVSAAWVVAYQLIMGEFENAEFGLMQWICFTAASLVNIIIMLNLLISILGDAYERAQMSAKENDTLEMLRLVLEYESMLFWRFSAGTESVIVKCSSLSDAAGEDEWDGRVNQMMKKMKEELKSVTEKLEGKLGMMERKINGKLVGVEEKLDKVLAALESSRAGSIAS